MAPTKIRTLFLTCALVGTMFVVVFSLYKDDIRTVYPRYIMNTTRWGIAATHQSDNVTEWESIHKLYHGTATEKQYIEMRQKKYVNRMSFKHNRTKNIINIAFYHPFHGGLIGKAKDYNPQMCFYKNCRVYIHNVIGDKPIHKANAVIFQGGHMPKVLPRRNNSDQIFIYQNIESPQYLGFTDLRAPIFTDFFNWTMTYRLDSDIPLTYGTVIPKMNNHEFNRNMRVSTSQNSDDALTRKWLLSYDSPEYQQSVKTADGNNVYRTQPKNYSSIFKSKTRSVAWFVSHCHTASKREVYVHKMSKHIDIDIYGGCSVLKCLKGGGSNCSRMVEGKYKFYLSFENSMCSDYITEKAYGWFMLDIVTVMRGDRDYGRHFPKGTYVDANDFDSPEALANYLHKLGSNETEYIKILQKRDQYTVIPEKKRSQIGYCQLCRMLNNVHRYQKIINNISKWWHGNGVCTYNRHW